MQPKYPRLPMPTEFITYLDEEVTKCQRFVHDLDNSAAWALQLEQTSYKIPT